MIRLATAMKILSNIHEILEVMSKRQFNLDTNTILVLQVPYLATDKETNNW
jgi:hypothetical protein